MKQAVAVVTLALALSVTGCARMTTQVVDKPRVDQEIPATAGPGGNRGYLKGTPPPVGERKTTRKMVQADIELKTFEEMNPWKKGQQQQLAQAAPAPATPAPATPVTWDEPAEENWAPAASAPVAKEPSFTTYTVKNGDNLEKISKKVYGTSSKWKVIYDANRDKLKSPNKIIVGQKLKIPSIDDAGSGSGAGSGGDEGWK